MRSTSITSRIFNALVRESLTHYFYLSLTMPRFDIHHITKYTYEGPVRDSANQIILFPVKDEYQEVLRQELTITGEPPVEIYKDYYGNDVGAFSLTESN